MCSAIANIYASLPVFLCVLGALSMLLVVSSVLLVCDMDNNGTCGCAVAVFLCVEQMFFKIAPGGRGNFLYFCIAPESASKAFPRNIDTLWVDWPHYNLRSISHSTRQVW